MTTPWIDIPAPDGDQFEGFLALPPTGKGPGLVLVQEIWGVNAHIRTVAQQYALDGYVVLAPDVYWRQQRRVDLTYDETDSKKAFELMKGLDADQAGSDIAAAIGHLQERPEVTGKVAVLGFCLGGQLAYRAAATGKPDAAVCYYGGGIQKHLELASAIRQPILFHYAGHDHLIPAAAIDQVREAMAGNRQAEFHVYPGVDHGFNCWGRPAYDQNAAALARGRTLQFLAETLKDDSSAN